MAEYLQTLTNYVWLIGGSIMSEPMCQEIKSRGYNLFLTDGNSNCHCRKYADMFREISVYDEFNHVAMARIQIEPPQAILCIGCDAGPTVSLLSEYFDLGSRTASYYQAGLIKNKYNMRMTLNLRHPEWSISNSQFNYPYVIKAKNLAGSKGFMVIRNESDLPENDYNNGDYFFEEYLFGKDLLPELSDHFDTSEVAMDFIVSQGKAIWMNGALRLFWKDQPGIEAGHFNPWKPDRKLINQVQKYVDKFELRSGVFKVDLKYTEKYGWCLLECATRPSGGFDHAFTAKLSTGRDLTSIVLDVALGNEISKSRLKIKNDDIAFCYAPRFKSGLIDGWYSTAHHLDCKLDYTFKLAKDKIRELVSNQDRPLFLIGKDDDYLSAMDKVMKISRHIHPMYSKV